MKNSKKCGFCGCWSLWLKTENYKLSGKGRLYTYTDDKGRPWAAGTCPSCAEIDKSEIDFTNKKIGQKEGIKVRYCRKCDTRLPASKYFYCTPCKPEMYSDDEVYSEFAEPTEWNREI